MSKEFREIVALAGKLNPTELVQLMLVLKQMQAESDVEIDLSESEKAEIRERFRRVEAGEVEMKSWQDVKQQIFGQ